MRSIFIILYILLTRKKAMSTFSSGENNVDQDYGKSN
jgi:hypothetical protein